MISMERQKARRLIYNCWRKVLRTGEQADVTTFSTLLGTYGHLLRPSTAIRYHDQLERYLRQRKAYAASA